MTATNVDPSNPEMTASDINKDGIITISDISLLAINWNDFRVYGDEP